MKKISIVVPTYNEEENVAPLSDAIVKEMDKLGKEYDYELIFIDNHSVDSTRNKLRVLCESNHRIKAIFNAKNFGQFNSPYYGLLQSSGDCTILMCADFQDPVEMIPEFIKGWNEGYKIVIGVKTSSQENKIMYFIRSMYYSLIKKLSRVEQIEHFTGFGLYDKEFIMILNELKDPSPFLRGIVAEMGFERKVIQYEQKKRRSGKTSNNLYSLYDAAMLSFTSYTKIGLRIATFLGFGLACCSFIAGVIYLIMKLMYWDRFVAGTAPILLGVFFFGAVQLIFIGLIGEYIMSINTRVMNRPLVIEEERINFKDKSQEEK